MATITFTKTESMPGYNNVKIGITADCGEEEIHHTFARIRQQVYEQIDIALENAGEPARYDDTSPRYKSIYTRDLSLRFIVPMDTKCPPLFENHDKGHRLTYFLRKHPDDLIIKTENALETIMIYLEQQGIIAVVYLHNPDDPYGSFAVPLAPTHLPRKWPLDIKWFESLTEARDHHSDDTRNQLVSLTDELYEQIHEIAKEKPDDIPF